MARPRRPETAFHVVAAASTPFSALLARYHTGGGRTKRVLAQDYAISCDSPSYKALSAYVVLMLFIFVVGLPTAAFLALWSHRRRGRGLTPTELAARDGALTALTRRYAPLFWWFEVVNVYTRLVFCGFGEAPPRGNSTAFRVYGWPGRKNSF